jgi:hypothetical protein
MISKAKQVRRVLREIGLSPEKNGKKTTHEVWGDGNGKEVELKSVGADVPHLFIHILSGQMETQGICSRRKFKTMIRHSR